MPSLFARASFGSVLLLALLFTITWVPSPGQTQQETCSTNPAQCNPACTPGTLGTRLDARPNNEPYHICFHSNVNSLSNFSNLSSGMGGSTTNWNNVQQSIPNMPRFALDITTTTQCNIEVRADKGVQTARWDSSTQRILVNPTSAQTWSANEARHIFTHELGHGLGLANVPASTGCSQSDTIMFETIDPTQNFSCSPTECDKTATQNQYAPLPVSPPPPETCQPTAGCVSWSEFTCTCDDVFFLEGHQPSTPILLAVGASSSYPLVGPGDGVRFDLNADGSAERTGWTRADDPIGFLVLDRNHNGMIDNGRELFGNYTPLEGDQTAQHGFEALAAWDEPAVGGNGDGWIDAADAVWPSLQVWIDSNHDGFSQPEELSALASLDITRISTTALLEGRRDQFGNEFRLRGTFIISDHPRWAYDVFFAVVR